MKIFGNESRDMDGQIIFEEDLRTRPTLCCTNLIYNTVFKNRALIIVLLS